jgi:SAM-dependent methyltransferase
VSGGPEAAAGPPPVSPDWLDLRESADAAARSVDLVRPVRDRLATVPRPVIHDLGCGTGSMLRWLAPLLPGRQHWVLHDRDPLLLKRAADGPAVRSADGTPVSVETRRSDITGLDAADLDGADLVTGSALLDMFTATEVGRIVAACAGRQTPTVTGSAGVAGRQTLITLSVVGRVELDPPDPLDAEVAEAFDAHQRRVDGGRRLLGPDAVGFAVEEFGRLGIPVNVRPSPWRLGAEHGALAAEWFTGWLGPACEQRPELAGRVAGYANRRLADAAAGRLGVVVAHSDLLAGCD